jgi:ketosteroid isomerase-like protein
MTHVETVKHVYDRFAHGDARAILATFTKDVEFRLAEGHPYQPSGEAWIGGDAITQHFFTKAGAEWEDWTFEIGAVVEAPDTVVVEGRYFAHYRPTDRRLEAQGCHVWRFRDGRIASFHQYVDTARVQHVMAEWPPHERPSVFPGVPAT